MGWWDHQTRVGETLDSQSLIAGLDSNLLGVAGGRKKRVWSYEPDAEGEGTVAARKRRGWGMCCLVRAKTLKLYDYARASLQLGPGNAACNATLRWLPVSLVSELPSSNERQ